MRNGERKRIVVLWGAHRKPEKENKSAPTSIDKGVPELEALGLEILPVFTQDGEKFLNVARRLASGRGRYFFAAIRLLFLLKADDVIYTTDNHWARWVARLKSFRLIKNRLVFKWAGFDLPWPDLESGKALEDLDYFGSILVHADVVFVISVREFELIQKVFQFARDKVHFWPTAVDIDYYKQFSNSANSTGLVAVGSDRKRDWNLAIEIAKRGFDVTLVTEDPKVERLVTELRDAKPETLTLAYKVGMERSAHIMANARALLISTLPNYRFSGSTTVGVAAALGKPLILDAVDDIEAYGLIPGKNCEHFAFGDADNAVQAISRVYDDPIHEQELRANIQQIADNLDVDHWANILALAFSEDWGKAVYLGRGATGQAVQS